MPNAHHKMQDTKEMFQNAYLATKSIYSMKVWKTEEQINQYQMTDIVVWQLRYIASDILINLMNPDFFYGWTTVLRATSNEKSSRMVFLEQPLIMDARN